jgi:hypothetical protein
LEAIGNVCRRYGVRELAIFGSALRDEFGVESDVDFLVEFDPQARIGLIAFAGLQEELTNIIGRKVDVVSKKGLKPVIRDAVLASAEIVYAA